MLQREVSSNVMVQACPHCGNKLENDRGLLHCREHGSFFAYGPHLLVRAPRKLVAANAPLPWENSEARPAS